MIKFVFRFETKEFVNITLWDINTESYIRNSSMFADVTAYMENITHHNYVNKE